MSPVKRSIHADLKELVVPCEFNGCDRRFINLTGMRTHLKMVHNISHKKKSTFSNISICPSCLKDFGTNSSLLAHHPNQCAERRKKLWKKLICQNINCGKSFEKYAGSNGTRKGQKYCSVVCANTSGKKTKNKQHLFFERACERPECSVMFITTSKRSKYCSKSCGIARGYIIPDTSNMGGLREGGGRSKALSFTSKTGSTMKLNVEEIRVANFLDANDFQWNRNAIGFDYIDLKGFKRKFHPDFYVQDLDLFVEYKGWITPEMSHKMKDAVSRNKELNLAIIVGDSPRFAEHGICISDLENDPSLLESIL